MALQTISSHHQAVAGETLTEVVKLRDKVDSLPNLIDSFQESIEVQIGRIVTTVNTLKTEGDQFATAQLHKAAKDIHISTHKTQSEFDERYRKASQESLKAMEEGAKTIIHHHVAKPISQFIREQKDSIWKTYGICFVCGLFGALVFSGMSIHFQNTEEEKVRLMWGGKLAKAWDKMDKKTKALIESQ